MEPNWNQNDTKIKPVRKDSGTTTDPAAGGTRFGARLGVSLPRYTGSVSYSRGHLCWKKAKIPVANKNEKQYNKTVQRVTAASAVRSAQGSLPWGHVRRGGETINWLLWRCQLLSFEERKPNSLPGSERLITASLVSKKMRPHESAPKACASFHVCICANQAPWRRTYAT